MDPISPRRTAGFNRADTTIALTLISVAALIVVPLLKEQRGGYTTVDVRTILAGDARRSLQILQKNLSAARRVFGRQSQDMVFLSMTEPGSAPLPLPGSRLPALRADEPPKTGPDPAAGNSLFFAYKENTLRFQNLPNGLGRSSSADVDILAFDWYFLAPRSKGTIGGIPARDLLKWTSIPYADAQPLFAEADITLRNSVIKALVAQGITNAYDVSASSSAAFFGLSSNSPWIIPVNEHRIDARSLETLTGPPPGNVSLSFIHSVSPNTGGTFVHDHPVPAFSDAEGQFPSGFEVRIWGPRTERKVFLRLVLAAEGKFEGIGSFEAFLSHTLPRT